MNTNYHCAKTFAQTFSNSTNFWLNEVKRWTDYKSGSDIQEVTATAAAAVAAEAHKKRTYMTKLIEQGKIAKSMKKKCVSMVATN